jgi:hypothetical protein
MDAFAGDLSPRDLYLDLLLRAVANTIYGDPNQSPWSPKTYDRSLRETGGDWPLIAHTMVGVKRLQNTRALCERAINENVPGDFIETGVWRGGASIMMRGVIAAYGDKSRTVICADSFAGLPKPSPGLYPKDMGDQHHTFDQLAISLEEVRSNFDAYGLLDSHVRFLKGFFKDTLPALDASQRFAVIRLDGDMYESTIQALSELYDKVSPNGFVIIDDYGAVPACKSAVDDFRAERKIVEPLTQVDWTGVWWQKPPRMENT